MEALTNPFMGLLPLPDLYDPMFFALAIDRVRLVGDPVALIVAESRYVAEDAAQLVVVDYEELEPIATIEQALDPTPARDLARRRRQRAPARPRDYGDVDAAFRDADRVVRETVRAAPLLEPADGDARVRRRGRSRRRARSVPLGHAEHPPHEVVARRAHRAPADLAVAASRSPASANAWPGSAAGQGDGARRTRPRRARRSRRAPRPPKHAPGRGADRRGPAAPASPGKSMAADVPARTGAHRAPRAHGARAARPGSGHVAARHRAGHRRRVRREGATRPARTSPCSPRRSISGDR